MAPNRRLALSRQAIGLTHNAVAEQAGIPLPSYCDLEDHDDEIFTAISLKDLKTVCDVLRLSLRELFSDGRPAVPDQFNFTFSQLSSKIHSNLQQSGKTIAQFEERAGWLIEDFLENPDLAWDWNIDGLRFVCRAIGMDWLSVLPR